MNEMGVTIVVPTLNRGEYLINCLNDLILQKHRPLEILVVDQSKDEKEEVVRFIKKHEDVIRYNHVSFKGLPEARNYGWQNARYNAIIYVDDDIRCGNDLVSEHLRALLLPGVGLVAGGINEEKVIDDTAYTTGVFSRWTATPFRGFAARGEGDVHHAQGVNFSAWRDALIIAGGFDENMNVGAALYEETDCCLRLKRAGFRAYFNGKARLTHLEAGDGGCREHDMHSYAFSLAHNRAILIRRHVRMFQIPVALMRLAILSLSYSIFYRSPSLLLSFLKGWVRGFRNGRLAPKITIYKRDENISSCEK